MEKIKTNIKHKKLFVLGIVMLLLGVLPLIQKQMMSFELFNFNRTVGVKTDDVITYEVKMTNPDGSSTTSTDKLCVNYTTNTYIIIDYFSSQSGAWTNYKIDVTEPATLSYGKINEEQQGNPMFIIGKDLSIGDLVIYEVGTYDVGTYNATAYITDTIIKSYWTTSQTVNYLNFTMIVPISSTDSLTMLYEMFYDKNTGILAECIATIFYSGTTAIMHVVVTSYQTSVTSYTVYVSTNITEMGSIDYYLDSVFYKTTFINTEFPIEIYDTSTSQHIISCPSELNSVYSNKTYVCTKNSITVTSADVGRHFIFNYTVKVIPPPLPPIAVIEILTSPIEVNTYKYDLWQTIQFSAEKSSGQGQSITTYHWTIKKEEIIIYENNSKTFNYIFPTTGLFNVTLTVTSENGLQNSTSVFVEIFYQEVEPNPLLNFLYNYNIFMILLGIVLLILSL